MREHESYSIDDFIENDPSPVHLRRETSLTVEAISELEGKPWTWVLRRVAPFKEHLEIPEDIREIMELKVPVEIVEKLYSVSYTNTPAEDWLTTTAMSNLLGVAFKWVNRRILYLDSPCEYRLFSDNRPLLHFSPEVLDELQNMRDEAIENIDPEKYVHLTDLARLTERHSLWVTNRLDSIRVDIKLGYDSSGRMVEYYPIDVIDQLILEKEKYEDSKEMLSIPMLSERVGKDREWVVDQLEELGVVGEYRRFEKSGRVDLSFDQGILKELEHRTAPYEPPQEGWFTANALTEMTGKSRNWVIRRLEQIGIEPSLREDSHGVLREHYPPAVVEELLEMKRGWQVASAMKSRKEEETLGYADQFRRIYELTGKTTSHSGLKELGATDKDIKFWMGANLLTRWSDGMYYFTKKAELVVQRMLLAEEKTEELREMREWLD